MKEFKDFNRNNNFSEAYDPDSFIGKWYDYGVWSDEEYWKLEKSLMDIKAAYPYPQDIPRYIVAGIFKIIDFLMVPNWLLFKVEPSPWVPDEVSIHDRYERFKLLLEFLFTGRKMDNNLFYYKFLEPK